MSLIDFSLFVCQPQHWLWEEKYRAPGFREIFFERENPWKRKRYYVVDACSLQIFLRTLHFSFGISGAGHWGYLSYKLDEELEVCLSNLPSPIDTLVTGMVPAAGVHWETMGGSIRIGLKSLDPDRQQRGRDCLSKDAQIFGKKGIRVIRWREAFQLLEYQWGEGRFDTLG